jgi:DnaJ-class molecular chaperone
MTCEKCGGYTTRIESTCSRCLVDILLARVTSLEHHITTIYGEIRRIKESNLGY